MRIDASMRKFSCNTGIVVFQGVREGGGGKLDRGETSHCKRKQDPSYARCRCGNSQ